MPNVNSKVPAAILTAAVSLLRAYHPALTEQSLETALQSSDSVTTTSAPVIDKPLTRRQVAELMGCSLQSVNRWMNAGTLKRVKIGRRAVRIDAASVRALAQDGVTGLEVRR